MRTSKFTQTTNDRPLTRGDSHTLLYDVLILRHFRPAWGRVSDNDTFVTAILLITTFNTIMLYQKAKNVVKRVIIVFKFEISDDSVPPTIDRLTSSQMLPWGAPKERTRFPSTVNIETDIRPGEFVMRTLFAEFTVQVWNTLKQSNAVVPNRNAATH